MIKKYSFYKLITEHIIEIPIIQRDYAQGRSSENVSYIRERFVKSLVKHMISDKSLHLGFVYGKIEGKDRFRELKLHEEAVNTLLHSVKQYANQFQIKLDASVENGVLESTNSLRFIPLDGQQRLTTLFLLYWYILMRKGKVDVIQCSWLTNFKYNNRKSSLAFFDQLIDLKNIQLIKEELKSNIQNQLVQYTWYLDKWNYDATVSGALVMLQAIHVEFAKYPEVKIEDLVIEKLPFEFDFLDLDELNQSDELYIKMNERGKQLTDFEHFKAWLQDYTEKKYCETKQKDFLKKFWKKLDTEWLNFFWKKIDVDYRSIDDFYFNYLKTMAITHHCATDKAEVIPLHIKELLSQIRNSEKYNKYDISYIPLSSFVHHVKIDEKEVEVFELFSFNCLEFIYDCFETTIHINDEVKIKQIDNIVKYPFVSNSITESLLKKNSFTINLWDHTYYYFILRLFHNKNIPENVLDDWLRITRNIVYNTYVQSPENLYDALHSINELFDSGIFDIKNEIQKETFYFRFFNQTQIREEVKKIKLLDQNWNADLLFILENHSYFYGQINFILQLSEENESQFKLYSQFLEKLFSSQIPDHLLQQALLSKGDYLVHRTNHSFCKTTTDSLRSRNDNWRSVFNNKDKREILKYLLDDLIAQPVVELKQKLTAIITSHNFDINDWQYYFLENSKAVQECKYNEIRWFSENDIRLLHSSTITGYHLELRTIFLFQEILESGLDLKPFEKLVYIWDKNTGGHPGIRLINHYFKEKPYNLDIYFDFKGEGYEFYFYNVADSIKNRIADEFFTNKLKDFIFDENFRHYAKYVYLQDVFKELTNLLKLLYND